MIVSLYSARESLQSRSWHNRRQAGIKTGRRHSTSGSSSSSGWCGLLEWALKKSLANSVGAHLFIQRHAACSRRQTELVENDGQQPLAELIDAESAMNVSCLDRSLVRVRRQLVSN